MPIKEKTFISEFDMFQTSSKMPLPVLPPLSEARSVKEKWNILLSKAKGGVENIPRAFLTENNKSPDTNKSNFNERQRENENQQLTSDTYTLMKDLKEKSQIESSKPMSINYQNEPTFKGISKIDNIAFKKNFN